MLVEVPIRIHGVLDVQVRGGEVHREAVVVADRSMRRPGIGGASVRVAPLCTSTVTLKFDDVPEAPVVVAFIVNPIPGVRSRWRRRKRGPSRPSWRRRSDRPRRQTQIDGHTARQDVVAFAVLHMHRDRRRHGVPRERIRGLRHEGKLAHRTGGDGDIGRSRGGQSCTGGAQHVCSRRGGTRYLTPREGGDAADCVHGVVGAGEGALCRPPVSGGVALDPDGDAPVVRGHHIARAILDRDLRLGREVGALGDSSDWLSRESELGCSSRGNDQCEVVGGECRSRAALGSACRTVVSSSRDGEGCEPGATPDVVVI